ncbi:NACHT, LRR and PYD domains-containing protein 14-like [Archocentrus centrarchus]|uniref:NACHT, LRR and PYD domains-containing protein 14-like n=1 Tax=Archocentrus centrarchus TaxID=63155 RepID=UPI0011E9B725|nr:NACHT, LRR and PYD domains-containing protein 14-like [Archocentrus centrarchus]XP_030609425.1 NACHT, LRR and PYD domains-containing protein 14-like [Archocentrus centrarchus]XP_030609426.1 NACHT, LRR and PYD domains-containing protein 14-like [Archocentrus centrarchus]
MAEKKRRRSTSMEPSSESATSSQRSVSGSAASSKASLKSDRSRFEPPFFGNEPESSQRSVSGSAAPSKASLKSDRSRFEPPFFGNEPERPITEKPSTCPVCKDVIMDPVQLSCQHWSCRSCLSSDNGQSDSPAENPQCPQCGKKSRKIPKQEKDTEEDSGYVHLLEAKKKFKKAMKEKYSSVSEGNGDKPSSLNKIYTELHITGESEWPHEEHEVRQLKPKLQRRRSSKQQMINLNDVLKPLSDQHKPHRTVVTKGVAGIGKSLSVQRFILDWAEEKANQDVDFVFSLAFRELNLITGEKSLHELLTLFNPTQSDLKDSVDYTKTKIVLILDGLDESRFQLDFEGIKMITSVREAAPVGNLLANLIQGNLLPDANVWITSRPAAANQIPAEHVDMVTEIRGFSDPQKAEYFRRRFSDDPALAERIIKHIESSQSLDIMCQIPIFCWISAVLFQEVFGGDEETEIPQTLTEMMAHFLFAQTKRRNRKYDKTAETNKEKLLKTHREFLLKLGKLAFDQVLKNNLIFYEEDLEACGIDIKEASIYSGFCTTVFQEEKIFSQKKVFFFVHLTLQEFCAALYVYECFINNETKELHSFLSLEEKEHTLLELLKMTVDKVLEKKNGHLDFFLRFLLGLMVEPNQRVLQGLLTPPDSRQDTDKKILTYLKSIRRKTLSPDSSINLFQAMVEMRDHKVKDEIQEYLKLSDHSKTELSPLHCSALAYMLQVSENDLDVFDLKSYNTTVEGRRRLIPAVRSSREAILADCRVTAEWVEHLAFVLTFPFSPLRHLDLSNNDLEDSGVELLCKGLSSQCCRLETLRLSGCLVTDKGCDSLVVALKSNPSHLKELDLNYNHPGDSGEKKLSELRDDPQYQLSKLNFKHGGSHRMKPGLKKYACELTLDPSTAHKNLLLSEGNRKVTWVEEEQPYPDHRYLCQQVLCEQGLKERCYFEVEASEPFFIGLTYRSIGRKGDVDDCKLGHNNKSWCLICSDEGCFVQHSKQSVCVSSQCLRCSRVGVYLDWEDGTLSFYRVSSNSLIHLYTFKTVEPFTEALYPAVELHTSSSVLFCQPI